MFYITIALLVLYVLSEYDHRRERTKLLNRLMAKDFGQYQYFEKKYPKDVAEAEKLRDEARDVRKEVKKEIESEEDEDSLY